ncbi:hypothetical protein JVT61DRAFT_1211 [Boletus reticuloceps]|uniref:Uncharacterized protein n=1 Tax=Boletus reticuloceps TaxID=495285 RepID=A0A8I2YS55_9AGAM|nr:hypothetical protein JVT61DRAFT_1211 [Boletus reticuloceps]
MLSSVASRHVRKPVAKLARTFSSSGTTCEENAVIMNRYSRIVTQPKDQGASQAMLYATDGVKSEPDLQKAMVGIASVWYEGNP